MNDADAIKQHVLWVIFKNLGETTAKIYREFSQNKEPETILKSANELLTEMMGKEKAQKELEEIFLKYNLNSIPYLFAL